MGDEDLTQNELRLGTPFADLTLFASARVGTAPQPLTGITLGALLDAYLEDRGVSGHIEGNTIHTRRAHWNARLLPLLGRDRVAASVTAQDIVAVIQSARSGLNRLGRQNGIAYCRQIVVSFSRSGRGARRAVT
jgi:hypothetical protein